ncbi:amidohydrolase family protein [bacterium]|nr:amidohydrolase family protein [bacterium]
MTLYLKNALHIDWKTLNFKEAHIAVSTLKEDSLKLIEQLPPADELAKQDTILDCRGKLVTRAFGCGHHHIYSTLARGMPAPLKTPRNFVEKLEYVWWHIDKNLDLEMIQASALASALFCAKNGVTFVVDHHASPFSVKGSLATIRDAFDAVGISHLLCYEISDRDGETSTLEGLAETDEYLSGGNQGLVGLHASFTVGDNTLGKAVELATKHNSGIHIHVAEDQADQKQCLETHQKRVIERLSASGALKLPKTILGHCIHLDKTEQNLLKDSNAWVVENVESNLNNNVGLANYGLYGDRIMLGTDGMHSDMLRSAKAAFFVGQTTEGIDFPGIYQRFRNVHAYLESNGFKGDSDNNLVVLDYDPPTEITADNFLGHFLFGLDSRHVESVISNGKLIVKEGELQTMDEAEILTFAREMGTKLWEKLKRK